MRLKNNLIIVVIFIFIKMPTSYGQNVKDLSGKESDSLIIWTKERKLKWSDFKSKEKTIDFGTAHSATSVMLEPYFLPSGIYDYHVLAGFYKNKSWEEGNNHEGLLKHEQLHFDIAELFARKMRREIKELKAKEGVLIYQQYHNVHKKYYSQYRKYQNQYDLDTDYSRVYDKQKEWEAKIAKELEELKDFSLKTGKCKTD